MEESEHDLDGPPRTDVSFSDCDGNRVLLFEIYRENRSQPSQLERSSLSIRLACQFSCKTAGHSTVE